MDPHQQYEIRCPVHGFVALNDWERDIIEQPAFQRLRRIRQLAWTDQVYPGAMHDRFEHSLGVMHTAGLLYDSIVRNSKDTLASELGYGEAGFQRNRQLVRLGALMHDVGHSPFSHASEDLFPDQDDGSKYVHEQYSAAIVRGPLRDVIENHKLNQGNYGFRADDIASLLEGSADAGPGLFWRDLITGQMDADRMDYLLRDSHHTGVHYGRFDLHRLINTMTAGMDGGRPRIGITRGGWHAAEALVLARYFMFTQVYFHKTRVAYDVHLKGALQELLPNGYFPKPTTKELKDFLRWDDWRVLGMLADCQGGEHGERLASRRHFRLVFRTNEIQTEQDRTDLARVKDRLGDLLAAEMPAGKSWYKMDATDIAVYDRGGQKPVAPLSEYSNAVRNLGKNDQILLYCRPEDREQAMQKVKEVTNGVE